MALDVVDLTDVEVALLGILSLGLPPARAAEDDTFRVDHCTAVVAGIREASNPREHLEGEGPAVSPSFAGRLQAAIASLTQRGLLTGQSAGMPAPPGGFEPGLEVDVVNPDLHPVVLDRWLGQRCLDELLSGSEVYRFLMSQYARAGEFWRTAREAGYGS
ncbi:MAG: hypothetical protein ACE5EF_05225 [Dehalococcoidia bacterium]